MSAIRFHRRYEHDGRCRVICMHCFQALGTAWDTQSLQDMEAAHRCEASRREAAQAGSHEESKEVVPRVPLPRGLLRLHPALLMLLTIVVLYALPTALEWFLAHRLDPWLAVILPGDLIGCAALFWLLRQRWIGLLAYLLLSAAETFSYAAGVPLKGQLVWMADSVPTVMVLLEVLRMKLRGRDLAIS